MSSPELRFGTIALICGLCSWSCILFFLCVPAVIFGHIALQQLKPDSAKAARLRAIVGLICGYAMIVTSVGALLLVGAVNVIQQKVESSNASVTPIPQIATDSAEPATSSPPKKRRPSAMSSELQNAVRDAVVQHYQYRPPASSQSGTGDDQDRRIASFLAKLNARRLNIKLVAYEVRNAFNRTIDGETWHFVDVAVEREVAARRSVELLPLALVKRGDSWYSQIDPEREIQELPNNSLSAAAAISLLSQEQQQVGQHGQAKQEETLSPGEQTVVASNGRAEFKVPGDWVKMPGPNVLNVGNGEKGQSLFLSSHPATNSTLEKEHREVRAVILDKLASSSVTDTVSLIIDGHPALQSEVRGGGEVYLYTTVDGGQYYYSIFAHTTERQWPDTNNLLHEVTASFHLRLAPNSQGDDKTPKEP